MNIRDLTPKYINLDEVKAKAPKYKGTFEELKSLYENGQITLVTDSSGEVTQLWVDSGMNDLMMDELAGQAFARVYSSSQTMRWIEMIIKGETLHEDTSVESHTDEVDEPEAECVEEDDSITVPAGCHVKNYLRKTYGHCFAKGSVQDWDVTENDDGSKTIRNVKWGRKLSPQELALLEY